MSWVKLDDQFFSHPKAREAGKDACLLYLAGLTYCARHLTDGKIPKSAVAIIAAEAWAKPTSAAKLIEVGFWHDGGDHYTAHDYLDHNPSREHVQGERAKRSRAGAMGAAKRWGTSTNGNGDGKCHSTPHSDGIDNVDAPGPSPSPTPREQPIAPAARTRARDPIFDALCAATDTAIEELTPTGRGPLNRAAKELRDLGATPATIQVRAKALQRRYPTIALTAPALVKHWATLGNGRAASSSTTHTLEESQAEFARLMEET
jgi:hypothetical protein